MASMRFLAGLPLLVILLGISASGEQEWWQSMSVYQIYPRSYKDSDGDGVGDLKGISSKLDHLIDANVDAFWLSPFYPSPLVDFGYDISNFVDVAPTYGTLEDFKDLVKLSHDANVKVIVDFVPNHSSDKHEWFQKSVQNIKPYSDYYVWVNGTVLDNGTIVRPNNWVSVFGGSAWEWNDQRQAYYLHQFTPQQPDLNYNNPDLVQEMKNVMKFWMDKGVDGFRIDAAPYLYEDSRLLDEPLTGETNDPNDPNYVNRMYTKDQPQNYEMIRQWREVLDEYHKENGGLPKVMMIEAYASMELTMKYYTYGANFPFNFGFIGDVNENSTAADFKNLVDTWMSNMPEGATANWVAGNHDNPRLATRFGSKIAQGITAMTLLLPGVGVTYIGDEIGMQNTWISWKDTKDPSGCHAGINNYESASRDPERTPFQWDNSTSAGFSTNQNTWLPVNPDYVTLNLATEKAANESFYKFYKNISVLKKSSTIREGNLTTRLLNDNVFAFSRELKGEKSVYTILNFSNDEQIVDLNAFDNLPSKVVIYSSTLDSSLTVGDTVSSNSVRVPAKGAVIYVGGQAT